MPSRLRDIDAERCVNATQLLSELSLNKMEMCLNGAIVSEKPFIIYLSGAPHLLFREADRKMNELNPLHKDGR